MSAPAVSSAVEVVSGTPEDLEAAVREAEDRCGYSLAELKAQALANDFESLAARMAWVALGAVVAQVES